MDWFEKLTGFREGTYADARRRLELVGDRLRSTVNGQSYGVGRFETPSLRELRARGAMARGLPSGKLAISNVCGDVRAMHRDAANASALFQVASQFNALEMTGPDITPEHGVTRYLYDRTQGPACAIAAGAATVYRNYFVPVDGQSGQSGQRQIDCLRDVGELLGNHEGALWEMRNGYALCTESGLAQIDRKLRDVGASGAAALRDSLRIGLHWQVEVTDMGLPRHCVSQAFCSALPVSHADAPRHLWRSFATLVLEGAYEATLLAGLLNAAEHGSRVVYLTRVGGGAFGNDETWIDAALRRALRQVEDVPLEVRIVSFRAPDEKLRRLVEDFG
jgi:hypothetical protein